MSPGKSLLESVYAVKLRNPDDGLIYTIGHYDTHPGSRTEDDVMFQDLKSAYETPRKLAFYLSRTVIPSNMEIAKKIRQGNKLNIRFKLPDDLTEKYDGFSPDEEILLMKTLRDDMKRHGN